MLNTAENLKNFAEKLKGKIILPADAEYDKTRQVFSGEIDKKPMAIVRVADAQDIQNTISFAREHHLELSVRSGGHSATGASVVDGGIVIDLRDMKKIEVDESQKVAWVETGLSAGEVTRDLDKYNLVLGFGDTGSVGVGGITLGGGIGFLVRKFGLTIDNLLAAEIITADGQILQVDSDHNPDLFWAIRGGGGNFGVVTRFKFKLHDLTDCYGGLLFLPATPEVIWKSVDIAKNAPEDLSVIYNIMPLPPVPFVPAEHHGKLAMMAMIMYAGDPQAGEKIVAPIRALATPLADLLKPMRYKDIYFPENDSYHPKAVARNMYLDHVDAALAEKIMTHLKSLNAPMKALQLRILGGAMSRVDSDATAYAHRNNAIMANVATFYETEEEMEPRQKWVNEFMEILNQNDPAVYVNFLGLHDEKSRIRNAYPANTWNRLLEIKHRVDPDNFFHNNANITE